MDVCVVLYRCDARRVEAGLRPEDCLILVDNTEENRGFAKGCNLAASMGSDELICFVNPDGDLTAECLDRLEHELEDTSLVAVGPSIGQMDPPIKGGVPTFLSGCCLVVRRSAFEEAGGFDERLFMYGEDVDLSLKLRRLGRIARVDSAWFGHDTGRKSLRAEHWNFRNHLVVMKRHRGVAGVGQMLRDAAYALRTRRPLTALARFTGVLDYILRARYWA